MALDWGLAYYDVRMALMKTFQQLKFIDYCIAWAG
jgi:hypothetical protein